ncbi:type II secretion system minor pseudopilin GspK [Metapseudomonas furukawaii]|uniref:Type II secretion system protein K n=1 Tax=Metapseudomonas furukawaii TaxID=1149133 RepID=A0AAD1C1U0_METFU|nr:MULTISPECIES: type II secretion system minor pseudopilin GspK [Pseudomonas]ELS28640.1 General secretion pathway protein K [Pseudomonas furukawaii]OWJ91859.1 general secretion pathway protein GspK [Pseudomonas sp. A46]BAU75225.1 general secretion pathway protein K [Pseudomonas furukawaii]
MKRQAGVALLTVMLVVAVVTLVSAGLIARTQLAIRSSGNELQARQAAQYALGGEALAKAILLRDLRQGDPRTPVDHLGEAWARPITTFALDDGGSLSVRIEDPSGRFNLNGLVRNGQFNEQGIRQFRRLLLRLGIEAPYAERLVDWLDADQEPYGPNGAEDNQYLLLQPPYRAANHAMSDVSELRLLAGMTELDYRKLLPYITALPGDATLNVNTASALVLSSLADNLDAGAGGLLAAARGATGFASLDAFLGQPALAGMGLEAQGLAVGSRYFQVITEVRLGGRRQVLVSTLQRGRDGKVRVLSRDLGQGGLPPAPIKEPQS